ncbi:transmembrane protein [Perilla frutescens var. hirtella]|nr:transmembrane protein [Perilla frutescens var. hirtella]
MEQLKCFSKKTNMIVGSLTVSCNSYLPPQKPYYSLPKSSFSPPKSPIPFLIDSDDTSKLAKISPLIIKQAKLRLLQRRSSFDAQSSQDPSLVSSSDENEPLDDGETGGGGGGEEERDWTTSFLLFAFWAGLMYYVFFLAPNQTPVTDSYFVRKLLNLTGDDGFELNQVLVALWYIMGLWPLVYGMLLIPTARSSKSKIPCWPFVVLSCFGGAYALIPYFVLWRPPAPPVEESLLRRWPLNFLESKLTTGIAFLAGLAIVVYAFSSSGDVWKEFYQYFKGSKFIHIMSIDFALLSTFAPFWVYNDMTARKWDGKGSWLLPLSLIPFLGPSFYLLLRPPLPVAREASLPTSDET